MGEYINNPGGGTIDATSNTGAGMRRNEAYSIGMQLGKSGKKGTWDLTYKWKNLEANYRRVSNVSGATIMGDGRVALILDVGSLVRHARH